MAGRLSIDYLNAKREQKHAQSGGANYARNENLAATKAARTRDADMADHDREIAEAYSTANAIAREYAAQLAAFRKADPIEKTAICVAQIFAEFRQFVAELPPLGEQSADVEIPF